MIHLEVEEYCHGCGYFDPDVNRQSLFSNNICIGTETTVRCNHRNSCKAIYRHLKEKMEKTEDKEGPET